MFGDRRPSQGSESSGERAQVQDLGREGEGPELPVSVPHEQPVDGVGVVRTPREGPDRVPGAEVRGVRDDGGGLLASAWGRKGKGGERHEKAHPINLHDRGELSGHTDSHGVSRVDP